MSYKAVVLGAVATLLVTAAIAASEAPSKPAGPTSTSAPKPAQPAVSQPGSTQMPSSHPSTAAEPNTGGAIPEMGHDTKPDANKPKKQEKMIDLNNASAAELKTIPGVGDAEAKIIIANRPYASKQELVTKAGLPVGIYVSAKHRVEFKKMKQPAAKTAEAKKPEAKKTGSKQTETAKPETQKSETKQ